jgi:protein O-GlcNAc transferase
MTIEEIFQKAIKYHQAGDLQQAENIYKEILIDYPNNFHALHHLGILYYQLKNYESAIEYIKKSLQVDPTVADAYYNLGNIHKDCGQLNEAMIYFEKSLGLDPNNSDAYNNEGIIYKYKKQLDEAINCFEKAIQLNPNNAIAHYNLGAIFQEKKQFDNAVACFQKVLLINPDIFAAYYNLGVVLQEKKQFDEAIANYQKAIQLNPNLADLYYNLATAFQEKRKPDDAIANYQKTIQLNPNSIDAYCNLGTAFQEKGEFDNAIECYQKAIQINPDIADLHCNLGNSLKKKGQLDEAIGYYRKAIQINPIFVEAYNNLGISLYTKGMLDEAIENYGIALVLKPDFVEAYVHLGIVYQNQGNLDKAEECFREALKIKPDCVFCYSNLLFSMNYNYRHDPQALAAEHLRFSKQIIEPLSFVTICHTNKREPNRKLRIGYVSPDFRRHPVSYFSEPVLIKHNSEHFEVFCYSNSPKHDEVTQRIQENADQWRNIVGMCDEDVTELIQKDEIDILVDLTGHTADNRILVFAQKPAPIQISWIGYLATTGLSTMDYKIVDNYTDPPGKTERFYTEKLLRLPESFLCYLPERDAPDVVELPALSAGHITFGSFNNFSKVTPEVFLLWAKILKELPDSCLILKGKSFRDKTTCQYAIDMFKRRDIAAQRIILQPPYPSPRHLESYNLVDIGLDTFPFNGAATTCEALWMGVPVITIAGTAYHSSVGISLLSNVGLKDLIAKTYDEYIRLAVNLSNDIERLKILRSGLRDKMAHSPLTDAERFTINLENSYREIWKTWCQSA